MLKNASGGLGSDAQQTSLPSGHAARQHGLRHDLALYGSAGGLACST